MITEVSSNFNYWIVLLFLESYKADIQFKYVVKNEPVFLVVSSICKKRMKHYSFFLNYLSFWRDILVQSFGYILSSQTITGFMGMWPTQGLKLREAPYQTMAILKFLIFEKKFPFYMRLWLQLIIYSLISRPRTPPFFFFN